jgi:hypothetical protein
MPRRRRYKLGEHLVIDETGTVRYASEVSRGVAGTQKGLDSVYYVDEPGRDDLPQPLLRRKEPRMRPPLTGPLRIIWEFYDENGNPV